MRSVYTFVWAGLAGIALVIGGSSCSNSPEGFCKGWVEDTCTALANCCLPGSKYDLDQCRIQLSQTCESGVNVEKVHSGEVVFDSGAANECFGSVETCSDLQVTASNTTFDHVRACANVITGYRPVGAECNSPTQCAKAGEFAACWNGNNGGPTGGGICAKVVTDDTTCSFSFDTNELHVCTDDKFCDLSKFKPSSTDPPTQRAFEFSAACKTKAGAGQACFSNGKATPCADGLFCKVNGTKATCTKQLSKGSTCKGTEECTAGLSCLPNKGGSGETCQLAPAPYCFTPVKCGDGVCNGSEDPQSCPADCSVCGDGMCTGNEDSQTCPLDCQGPGNCGDGVCDIGEIPQTCPQDCDNINCGDGFCDSTENIASCSSDCFCGNGTCDPGENSASCTLDC